MSAADLSAAWRSTRASRLRRKSAAGTSPRLCGSAPHAIKCAVTLSRRHVRAGSKNRCEQGKASSGCDAESPRRRGQGTSAADLLAAWRPTREYRRTPAQEASRQQLLVLALFCTRVAPRAQI